MKTWISWFLIGAMCVMSILTLLHPKNEILEQEKRNITSFPTLRAWDKDAIRNFFHQVDMFYMDRLEFRDSLICMASLFPKQNDTSTCYEGKQNWLFLGNNYNRTVDALTGALKLDARDIRHKTSAYMAIQKTVEKHGAVFHMMIGPNKSTIYPEFLPRAIRPARGRFIQPLLSSLLQAGVHVFDPTETLLSRKDGNLLYWRTDTHWNKYGTYLAMDAFMHQARLSFLPPYTSLAEGSLHRGDLIGILGNENYPVTPGDNAIPVWDDTLDMNISGKKVLLIGDSFSVQPCEYLKMVYPVVHRIHYHNISRGAMETFHKALDRYLDSLPFQPDIVLWIQVERAYADFL